MSALFGGKRGTNSLVGQSTTGRHGQDRVVSVGDGFDVVERPRMRVAGEDCRRCSQTMCGKKEGDRGWRLP